MEHTHSKWLFWYNKGCPVCMVRQLQYGYRLDPGGYYETIKEIRSGSQFDYEQKKWILRQVGELK